MKQQIRFCRSFDGTRLAYATSGEGPPAGPVLVRAPHWLTHLEYEAESPLWRPWLERLSGGRALVRMDARGCGLSDRDVSEFTFGHYVNDLEAVIDAAGVDRFALFGHSQGGAIAVEYAARYPQRVTHLVLLGAYARGSGKRGLPPEFMAELEAQLKLVEVGWGRDDAAYRAMFSTQFVPGATLEQLNSLSELQRRSASAANAVRLIRSFFAIDAAESALRVRCPTLVFHARDDRRVPLESGRQLAALIPGARFVTLESANHILLAHEPAFEQFFDELRAFLPGARAAPPAIAGLTAREGEILERIARGLDNAQIAAQLGMSEKTVRNHITHVFDKLGVQTRAQAIVRARDAGLGRESRAP
jgi:pimeloyl-ACP methyl ester carboxylesterase/DNA-binding CsgD family transcriptional regulator